VLDFCGKVFAVTWLRALLLVVASACFAPQRANAITYLRLGPQVVAARSQFPTSSDWPATLRGLYAKAGIPPDRISEQKVPGSSLPNLLCIIPGTSKDVIVVSASLDRPSDDGAAAVAWGSLAMLPLLAQSIAGVTTESTFVFIAFSGDKRHRTGAKWFVQHSTSAEREKIKAAVEILNVGRSEVIYTTKHRDQRLGRMLGATAFELGITTPPQMSNQLQSADAREFSSAAVSAITISTVLPRVPESFYALGRPVNKLHPDAYYTDYQLLSVFLLHLDREPARVTSHEMTSTGPTHADLARSCSRNFAHPERSSASFALRSEGPLLRANIT
jgi:hypothetical protein